MNAASPASQRLFTGLLLWLLAASYAHATSPCDQWSGNEVGSVRYDGPWRNSPNDAALDVFNHCMNDPNGCGSGANCPPAGPTTTCDSWSYVLFGTFPNSFQTINYVSHYADGSTHPLSFAAGTNVRANPVGGCQVYVSAIASPPAQCGPSCNGVGDPISPASGGMYIAETDIESPAGQLAFKRFYNSTSSISGDLGTGWRHSFSRNITKRYAGTGYAGTYTASAVNSSLYADEPTACTSGFTQIKGQVSAWAAATATYANGVCTLSSAGTQIGTLPLLYSSPPTPDPSTQVLVGFDATRDDGQVVSFQLNGTTIVAPPSISLRLIQTGSGYTLTDDNDNVEMYNTTGALLSVTSRAGVVATVSYNGAGQLSGIVDSFGQAITLTHATGGALSSATDPSLKSVHYGFDGAGRLSTITNLDTTTKTYLYENSSFPTLVTGLMDENSNRYSTWGYDTQARATSSSEALGADATGLVYNSNGSVTVTDALGAVRTFSFARNGDRSLVAGISGSQCPTCQESASTTYDNHGWVASRTDYNGNLTCYANDPVRGLELVRVEGFAPSSTCPSNLSSYAPQAGTLQRKITTQWHTTWREPQTITEPNRTTSFTYDPHGNVLTKTVTDTSVTPNVSRTWTYVYYNSGLYGQVHTLTGPRTDITTDVTTYTYYSCTTGNQCGRVQTLTNGLGQITTFNTYNAYGQPLTVTDPNNIVTTLTYDARQRLTSSAIGTESTGYTYYPTGRLKLVTRPDSSTILYAYDGAHRLTDITDGLANHIHYTLDAIGNRTAENAYDPGNALHRTHTRAYNTLSELYQDIDAAGTSAVTTTYGYDSNGNQTSVAAPLSRNTADQYDALNRLSQITDPNNGITALGYDANDNLATLKDPRTFTTSYSHDGFGDLTQIISPDTGTTINTYDSGGNLKTATDARSALATYAYDALNRVSQVAYTDQTINFTYDVGTNGKGRLTGASDANHSLSWTYDPLGRVTGKGQTVAGVTKSVGYSFTNGDMTSLVTPSGQTITYTYSNHRITSILVGSTTLLSGVTYDPFGPPTGWTWGNSTTVSRAFDQDGNPHQIVTAAVTNAYTVDNASRITGLSDSGLSTNTWTFGYDTLDRVTSGVNSAKSRGYTYDANSNRLTTTGTTASTEIISTTNNRLNSTSGGIVRTYGYDNAGNTTSYTGDTFNFKQRGRMSSATVTAGTTNYLYNALGQLIEKSGNGSTTLLVYDEAGHLLGEYSSSGALIQETIWMGDLPVATLRPNGSTGCTSAVCIFYVHSDHLGTARKVTRPSDNGLFWRWDPDTFGTVAANANPAGLGTFVYNLRFPGQYYLAETGLHYNYFRTYDPTMGRYLESDPIGLKGGINPYAYAGGNPISYRDPNGLTVQIVGSDPIATAQLQAAYNRVANTLTGSVLTSTLENSPFLYTITNNILAPQNAYWDPSNNLISVDPNFHPTVQVANACGREESSTEIILAHELGHAVRNDPFGHRENEWPNVLENENPIRLQMGLPPRTAYPMPIPFVR